VCTLFRIDLPYTRNASTKQEEALDAFMDLRGNMIWVWLVNTGKEQLRDDKKKENLGKQLNSEMTSDARQSRRQNRL